MTPRQPVNPVDPTDVVEFVIHGTLAPRLIDWLNREGFDVMDWPSEGLRTFMVSPGQEMMRAASGPNYGHAASLADVGQAARKQYCQTCQGIIGEPPPWGCDCVRPAPPRQRQEMT